MYDVRHVLRKAGLRSTYSGYNYLASAVALVLKDQEFYLKNVTSNLYRLLSALRRFDKSVCFFPAPKHLTSKPRMAAGSLLSGSLPLEISPGKNVPYLQ